MKIRRGYSLIETLVTAVVIGILSAAIFSARTNQYNLLIMQKNRIIKYNNKLSTVALFRDATVDTIMGIQGVEEFRTGLYKLTLSDGTVIYRFIRYQEV